MNPTEHELQTLLHTSTSDLTPEVETLVAGGIARGRRQRRRRTAGSALAAVAVIGVIGTAASVVPGLVGDSPGGSGSVARGPTTSPAPPTDQTEPSAPRELSTNAAGVPDTFAHLFPGEVQLIPGKENPQDGFDPRSRPGRGPAPDFAGEPGPGVLADFTWNGFYVRAAVAPSDPALGETPLERCRAEEGGGNGTCQPQANGGVLRSGAMTNPPEDGTATVRWAQYYTPDLWTVYVLVSNGATSRDTVLAAEPPFTEGQLVRVVTSAVWFE